MKIPTIVEILVGLIVLGGMWFFVNRNTTPPLQVSTDYKNATYMIEGQPVTLVDGHAETAIASSSASIVTQYFGNEATGDLNGDGVDDVAFILTQTTGGSGTFYYAVAALKSTTGYQGTSAVLLGDRIAPQPTEIKDGQVVVNYADRKVGEPMTTQPSEGKSLWLKLDLATMQFGEVAQNFEGEADPARMTLGMQTWTWVSTLYNDDKKVTPKKEKAFTLTFKKDGNFSATTDCNGVGGAYEVKDNKITFSKMMSTLMYCDGSQEGEFTGMLNEVQSYHFTSKGELIFDLKLDSGSSIFR